MYLDPDGTRVLARPNAPTLLPTLLSLLLGSQLSPVRGSGCAHGPALAAYLTVCNAFPPTCWEF